LRSRREAFYGAAASLSVAIWLTIFVHGVFAGEWNRLFLHGEIFSVPAELHSRTVLVPGPGYDGQFYRLAAYDPWLRRGFSEHIDAPHYRRQRLLLPGLAWVTAAGRDEWIDAAYIGWSVAFCGLGVYWLARLSAMSGLSPLWGFSFLLFPGTVLSIHRMLTDGPLLALSMGAIYYSRKRANVAVALCLAAACLCRDLGALLAVAVAVPCVARRDWRGAFAAGSALVPMVGWYAWLTTHLPATARVPPGHFFGLPPFGGLIGRMLQPKAYNVASPVLEILHLGDLLALLGVALAVGLSFWLLRRDPLNPVVLTAVSFAAVAALLWDPTNVWNDLYAFGRATAPMLGMLDITAIVLRDWRYALPTLLQMPRLGLEFASPMLAMARSLTSG
jgi:hypothetical protein